MKWGYVCERRIGPSAREQRQALQNEGIHPRNIKADGAQTMGRGWLDLMTLMSFGDQLMVSSPTVLHSMADDACDRANTLGENGVSLKTTLHGSYRCYTAPEDLAQLRKEFIAEKKRENGRATGKSTKSGGRKPKWKPEGKELRSLTDLWQAKADDGQRVPAGECIDAAQKMADKAGAKIKVRRHHLEHWCGNRKAGQKSSGIGATP